MYLNSQPDNLFYTSNLSLITPRLDDRVLGRYWHSRSSTTDGSHTPVGAGAIFIYHMFPVRRLLESSPLYQRASDI